jgi:hypothetical protein
MPKDRELNLKKGVKGFRKKRTSLELSLLECIWCKAKKLEGVYEKFEITDSQEKIDLAELRPSWNSSEDKPYMHKKCKAKFDYERKYKLCHCCKHRLTGTTTPAQKISDLCNSDSTFMHPECFQNCSVKSNYKGRVTTRIMFAPETDEGYRFF